MSANDYQAGGNHYKTSYEHWDLVLRTGMDYLVGNATKYIARSRKKGGRDDLLKALHYIDKLLENWTLVSRTLTRPALAAIRFEVGTFSSKNNLNDLERSLVMMLATWGAESDLRAARTSLREHLDSHVQPPPKPAPLEDSNKHAERAGDESQSGDRA